MRHNIVNLRSLATGLTNKDGKMIRPGAIMRCGLIGDAGTYENNLVESLGITHIYDVRSKGEIQSTEAFDRNRFIIHQIQIMQTANQNDFSQMIQLTQEQLNEMMISMYRSQIEFIDIYGSLLTEVLEQKDSKFLMHCTAGKDRIGIVAAIIMVLLGFSREAVVEEYLRYDKEFMDETTDLVMNQLQLSTDEQRKRVQRVIGTDSTYIEAFLDSALNSEGDLTSYFKAHLGLSQDMQRKLMDIYLMK